MSKDLNKVMLTGYLGADPEMRYTPQGSAVTTFRVGSGRSWKSSDGMAHDDTEWFRVVAWDKLAETCNQYLVKGTRVYVEGRLQTRQWQDQNGQDRWSTEVVANDMIILSRKDRPAAADEYAEAEPQDEAPAAPSPADRRQALREAGRGDAAPAAHRPAAASAPAATRPAGVRVPTVGRAARVPAEDQEPF